MLVPEIESKLSLSALTCSRSLVTLNQVQCEAEEFHERALVGPVTEAWKVSSTPSEKEVAWSN